MKKDEMEGWVPASYLEPVHHNPEVDVIPKSDGKNYLSLFFVVKIHCYWQRVSK